MLSSSRIARGKKRARKRRTKTATGLSRMGGVPPKARPAQNLASQPRIGCIGFVETAAAKKLAGNTTPVA